MKSITAKLSALGLSAALSAGGGFIAVHEGYVPGTYIDPVGVLTACFGSTGQHVEQGRIYTDEECLSMFAKDLVNHNRQLMSAVKVPLSEQEHAAYLSFHYNVGAGNFRSSTLLRYLNADLMVEACNELPRWVYAKGIKLPGLVTRRAQERDLCLQGALSHE